MRNLAEAPDCSSLSGAQADLCTYVNTLQIAEVTPVCEYNQYLGVDSETETVLCFNYSSPIEKSAGMLGDQGTIDSGNTAWLLTSSALVMLMTPGLAFFYAGLAGRESAANTIMMSLVSMALVTVQWYVIGYSLTFGPGHPVLGNADWAVFQGVGYAPSGVYGVGIPHYVFAIFQCMFAQITPALISGAVVGRMKFSAYIVFILAWTTLIYNPLAHWVWAFTLDDSYALVTLGWLGTLGSIDFAGGTCIHIASGFSALAAALILGKRANASEKLVPHNVPLVVLGGSLLWFGWFGFNAGSAVAANGVASLAFVNTHFAACTGFLTWMLLEYVVDKSVTASGAIAGAVAGLVCITPGCGFVQPWAALLFGIFVAPPCFFAIKLKSRIGFDDTLDSFAVHGVGGVVGALLTGLFADPSLNFATGGFYGNGLLFGVQIAAVLVAACWSFFGTAIILLALRVTIGIRVSLDAEKAGLDSSYHGGAAYNDAPKEEKI